MTNVTKPINQKEMQFVSIVKITFYLLCFIGIISLLNDLHILHTKSWHFLPVGIYDDTAPDRYYILLWTFAQNVPFKYMEEGISGFISRRCPYTNCIVTANETLLSDHRLYDVIAFDGSDLAILNTDYLPKQRLPYQKYVFTSVESSAFFPICTSKFDGYFNWTWTYKLDSEVKWSSIMIRDAGGNIIGPQTDMQWIDFNDTDQVSETIKKQLKRKSKAALWLFFNCGKHSYQEHFGFKLQEYLRQYSFEIDIYQKCGELKCPLEKEGDCSKIIREEYYFYLSFENALSEDYVTEGLLMALQNYAVPIVYGGANYTRFLPHMSYLNARELGVYALGDKMIQLIDNPDQYAEYFRWTNHYSYHRTTESVETDEYCQICALLNSEKMKTLSVYENFRDWWDPPNISCPSLKDDLHTEET